MVEFQEETRNRRILQENNIENIKNITNKISEEKAPILRKDRPIQTEVKQSNPNKTPSNI